MWSVFIVDDAIECAGAPIHFDSEPDFETGVDWALGNRRDFISMGNFSGCTNCGDSDIDSDGDNTSDTDGGNVGPTFGEIYNYVIFAMAPTNVALNLVAMSIFYKEHRRRLLYYYMVLLCCVDTLFQICFCSTIALYIVLHVHEDVNVARAAFVGILLVRFLAFAAQLTRNWTVAFIAAYRCELIMMTAAADHSDTIFNNRKVAGRIWAVIAVFLLIASIPRSFDTALVICNNSVFKTNDMENTFHLYGYLYHGAALFVLQSGGPVISVLVTSILTIRTLHLQIKYRKEQSRLIQRSNANRMVIAISIIFLLCEMPAFFSKVIHATKLINDNVDRIVGMVGNLFIVLDSTFNFFVYVFANGAFRRRLLITCLHVYARRIPNKRRTVETLARIPLDPAGDALLDTHLHVYEVRHAKTSRTHPAASETDIELLNRRRTPKNCQDFP